MYQHDLHSAIHQLAIKNKLSIANSDNLFYQRIMANAETIHTLFFSLYDMNDKNQVIFLELIQSIFEGHLTRDVSLQNRDAQKLNAKGWFLSNDICGMSLYVDRFCGSLKKLNTKLEYLKDLGVNLVHLMPLFESPESENDGGYAVSNYKKVDNRLGTLKDLKALQKKLANENMYLMLDIVLNHTSNQHEWAIQAKNGNETYQHFYYTFEDRKIPDEFERNMPEIFPEAAPGNFTYVPECNKWVMTVFHNYQWDLNYRNPTVLKEMVTNVLFYANLGVDILRVDAPVFLWKEIGTSCQNLPQIHTILCLIKQCVQTAAPGMAILSEAIVSPKEIIKHFGTGAFLARECDIAYNATHMALQWEMLATGNTKVMLAAQPDILQKPLGVTWINYTRCHDDIGLGFGDDSIQRAGFTPKAHRQYLYDYYSGLFHNSPAQGVLFGVSSTGEARICGTLASLCGLGTAQGLNNNNLINLAIKKIILMQAHCLFLGGIPMLYYGDEVGYLNDISYLNDSATKYDNRWIHRPKIDWGKNNLAKKPGTIEHSIFTETKKLISLRKSLKPISDNKNLTWVSIPDARIACFQRHSSDQSIFCVFNFSSAEISIQSKVLTTSATYYINHFQDPSDIHSCLDQFYIEPYGILILEFLNG